MEWKYRIELSSNNCFMEIEENRSVKLSDNFKEFIARTNAASPSVHNISFGDKELCFGSVYSFNLDEEDDVDVVRSVLGYVDNKFVPFACDPAGNVFCINPQNDQIYFYYLEEEDYIDLGFKITEMEGLLH